MFAGFECVKGVGSKGSERSIVLKTPASLYRMSLRRSLPTEQADCILG
jgi:hypothetical protein